MPNKIEKLSRGSIRQDTREVGYALDRERAYELLRKKMILLELAPGVVLNEADLTESLGIGRTPIHEALLRLAVEGFVRIMLVDTIRTLHALAARFWYLSLLKLPLEVFRAQMLGHREVLKLRRGGPYGQVGVSPAAAAHRRHKGIPALRATTSRAAVHLAMSAEAGSLGSPWVPDAPWRSPEGAATGSATTCPGAPRPGGLCLARLVASWGRDAVAQEERLDRLRSGGDARILR